MIPSSPKSFSTSSRRDFNFKSSSQCISSKNEKPITIALTKQNPVLENEVESDSDKESLETLIEIDFKFCLI